MPVIQRVRKLTNHASFCSCGFLRPKWWVNCTKLQRVLRIDKAARIGWGLCYS